MTTVIPGLFQINGVISTDRTVMQNIKDICTAAGCWMTYDITEGKWSVVMNRAGSSVASFNDSNIIGGINVSGKGISELYNAVTIQFPHKDLRDQTDYIDFEIAAGDRFPNELDNRLNIAIDLANNPVQAQYIAGAELKQSRVDKVIEFRTDFSMIGLKAGDLIDITSTMYGYTSKIFRITKIQEDDGDSLQLSITALEYDANVYDTSTLIRKERNKKTGIVPKSANATLAARDSYAVAKQNVEGFPEYLTPALLGSGALNLFLQRFAQANNQGMQNNPALLQAFFNLMIDDPTFAGAITGDSGFINSIVAVLVANPNFINGVSSSSSFANSLSSNATFINSLSNNSTFVNNMRAQTNPIMKTFISAAIPITANSYGGNFDSNDLYDLGQSFTILRSGTFEVFYFIDFGGSNDGTQVRKKTGIFVSKNGVEITSQLGGTATTFDYTATNDKAADQVNVGKFTANSGDTIALKLYSQTSASNHQATVYGRVTYLGPGAGV